MQRRQVYEWLRRHPYVFDASLTAVLLIFNLFYADGNAVITVGMVAPLIWRRRYPALVFTVVSLTCLAQLLLQVSLSYGNIGFLFALYAASAYGRHTWVRLGALAVGCFGALLTPLALSGATPDNWIYPVGFTGAAVALAWTLGDLMRTRRAYVGELEERARRLELERDQQARLARADERARIAREFHDIVAHSLSVVVAQADGGSYAAAHDPAAARKALETIGMTGRKALAEMRRLLGVLRTDDELATLAPQPDLRQLPDLLDRMRSSGLDVRLHLDAALPPLPAGVELAIYRIVQEALTNTLKHAGPGTAAIVRLTYKEPVLRLEISDNGRGTSVPADGSGHGLVGMRERVALYGGTVTAGPRTGGGFEVVAELPFRPDEGA